MCVDWEGVLEKGDARQRQCAKEEHMRRAIKSWGECGKIVYIDNKALAFAQYAPPEFWHGVRRYPSGPVSDDAVLLSCLYVAPQARGRGLGRVLLQSIEAGLVKRRVKAIEVFATTDNQHPPGPIGFYLQNGFYIIRDDPHFPLLRLELKALVGWQINIQFALDGLRFPARRVGAPASLTI